MFKNRQHHAPQLAEILTKIKSAEQQFAAAGVELAEICKAEGWRQLEGKILIRAHDHSLQILLQEVKTCCGISPFNLPSPNPQVNSPEPRGH